MRSAGILGLLLLLGMSNTLLAQATGAITGRVVDGTTQRPLTAVSVVIEGMQRGVVTRADGGFLLTAVPEGAHRVRASQIGYGPQVVEVTVTAGQTATAQFSLQPQAVQLDELVAVGYGMTRRRDVTGAVASVSGDDVLLRAAPTATLSTALQGRAPGVQVVTNSGMPGVGASVRVRGTNSLAANSEPLYVIDGVPAAQGTSSRDPTQSPLNQINPNDVESIEILKDASATAIYGARGANGVILITTRRGARGEDRFVLESSYGTQQIAKRIEVLNAQQYRELRNEALVNVGEAPFYADVNVPSYDYQDMLLRTAPQQNHSLSFSGGDDRTRYLVSGNFMSQEGIIRGTDFERFSGRLNLDREFGDRFRMGTSLSLAHVRHNLSQVETGGLAGESRGILGAMVFDPALPPRDQNGAWNRRAVMGEFINNPLATVTELTDQRNDTRFLGNVFGELDIVPGLRLRSSLAANLWDAFNPYYAPRAIHQGVGPGGEARVWQGRSNELLNENLLTYRGASVGPGSLDMLGGFTVQTNSYTWNQMVGQNFLVEDMKWRAIHSGANRPAVSSGESEWALLSYLGRANYNLMERYLFTVTGRYDGSSRFGAENKWAFFPSAALAWRISEEAFMQNQNLFSNLGLRLSYGVTGNQAVGPYQSLAGLSTVYASIGGRQVAFAPGGSAPNPALKWETTRQFNTGLDMGFLAQRVNLSTDVYHSKTEDLLLTVNVPFVSGFTTQLQNIGSVQNRGIEMALNTINVESPRFGWRSTLNLAANRNKVLAIDAREHITTGDGRLWGIAAGGHTHIIKPGQPLGSIYGYKVDVLYQQGTPCTLTDPRPTLDCVPGELRILDLNGDGRITPDDRTIIGSAEPTFYGGFNNGFTSGPFSLDAFVSFSYGGDVVNLSNAFLMNVTGQINERAEVLNRWTPTNTNTDIPRANANRRVELYSTLVEDGSYLRLQTLTFGYQVPRRVIPGASTARLFLTGQNLLTLTGYSGFDPEVNSLGGDPATRGVDAGAYPRARVFNAGVTVTF
jgi:TonB-dependent starch-binding outer membrane protein SusC